jgi:hypothetical protein
MVLEGGKIERLKLKEGKLLAHSSASYSILHLAK